MLGVVVYKALNNLAPPYLSDETIASSLSPPGAVSFDH